MSSLPSEVLDLVKFRPLEDLILRLLRDEITTVPIQSLIRADQEFPFVLVRRGDDWGNAEADSRFVTTGLLAVHTFADGLNADEDAALLGEAVRNVLTHSINKVVPGFGHLTMVDPITMPNRKSDWATATGPVQYADLPTGVVRYESLYEVAYRRPL